MNRLDKIRIILIETTHSGNLGSVARAMKTMGLTQLFLVNPLAQIDAQAIAMAAGAEDILKNAIQVETLIQATGDCHLVVGTSARARSLAFPVLSARSFAEKAISSAPENSVAILFGRERTGLTNEVLQQCNFHVEIPANSSYSSLNLAMAVQILAYELRVAALEGQIFEKTEAPEYPDFADVERFYAHLETVLRKTEFIKPNHPGMIMPRLRRLFSRARIEKQELNILRGVLTSVEKFRNKNSAQNEE